MELSFLILLLSTLTLTVASSKSPFYVGEVFAAPAMNFMAWRPSSDDTWCHTASTVSNDGFFTLPQSSSSLSESTDQTKLQLHDYFTPKAWISRDDGTRYAECAIGPNAVGLATCEGMDELRARAKKEGKTKADLIRNGELLVGIGKRKWTCWALDGQDEL